MKLSIVLYVVSYMLEREVTCWLPSTKIIYTLSAREIFLTSFRECLQYSSYIADVTGQNERSAPRSASGVGFLLLMSCKFSMIFDLLKACHNGAILQHRFLLLPLEASNGRHDLPPHEPIYHSKNKHGDTHNRVKPVR